jgi:predicted nucleic acid-binding protein
MKAVFADTGYWIACVDPKDVHYIDARKHSEVLVNVSVVTSEMVLTELLAHFSNKGSFYRKQAIIWLEKIKTNANVVIVPQTSDLFWSACKWYAKRPDKNWSLTDCASFEIMKRRHIKDALAYDHHFEQAGFITLLK